MQSQYQKFFALERPLHHFCAMQALLEMVPLPLTPCGLGEVRVGGYEEFLSRLPLKLGSAFLPSAKATLRVISTFGFAESRSSGASDKSFGAMRIILPLQCPPPLDALRARGG